MRLLLDTHIFLWYISGDPNLPDEFGKTLRDPVNTLFLSVASVWEAVIKYAIGKLPMPEDPSVYLPRERVKHEIDILPLEEAAMVHLAELPPLHRDPFDRMLIAQALQYDLMLVTVDDAVRRYPVALLPEA